MCAVVIISFACFFLSKFKKKKNGGKMQPLIGLKSGREGRRAKLENSYMIRLDHVSSKPADLIINCALLYYCYCMMRIL